MSLDERHLQLRKRLDKLGFNQPLPIGAIGLVSALVDDLIQTTESLKEAKYEISELLDAKAAWDLGVEPYKCDNSRLLAEVNNLYMKILKQQDAYELEAAELRVKVRSLTYNNKVLAERNHELNNKVKDLELKFLTIDNKKQSSHVNRRPFVSTVRSSIREPPLLDLREPLIDQIKCKCSCALIKRSDVLCEIEKLQNEVKNQADILEAYKKQLDARDREIKRLNALFVGGRPANALAKDCCYRNVTALTEDIEYLQKQKMELQRKLEMNKSSESGTINKIIELTERNDKLEQDLKDIEKVALHVETQANIAVMERDKEILKLKETIASARSRLLELERGLFKEYDNVEYFSMKDALKDANEEKRKLNKQVNEATAAEQILKKENEKLKLKYNKLKVKIIEVESEPNNLLKDLEKTREQKEYYQKEYSKLLMNSKSLSDQLESINRLSKEVTERNVIIADLKMQIIELQHQHRPRTTESDIHSNMSIQATIHRLERERDVAIANQNQMMIEHEKLKDKIRSVTDVQLADQQQREKIISDLNNQIFQLQAEKRELTAHQVPTSATINRLKEDTIRLKDRIMELEAENSHVKVNLSQTKILLEQTERAMSEQKNKISHSEHHIGHVEQHINKLETDNKSLNDELFKLKSELNMVRTNYQSAEEERDRLRIELELKTERLYHVETTINGIKCSERTLQDTVDKLQRKLSNMNTHHIEKESTLRAATSETEQLRKQILTLKRTCDNALNDNSRLSNELADAQAELMASKQKYKQAVGDTEKLKQQIKDYVSEVDRVNTILADKEQELLDMIDNYKSMTMDAQQLESERKSLTTETTETRKQLGQAESRIHELENLISVRDGQITGYEKQVNALSCRVSTLEKEIEGLRSENQKSKQELYNAKLLIDELEKQKSMVNVDLANCLDSKRKLEEERDRIKTGTYIVKGNSDTQASVESLKRLLEKGRREMEQYQMSAVEMSQEVIRLKEKIKLLQEKLGDEHDSATKSDALAKEYKVQVQELRRMITDERFETAKSTEDPNPYPTL